MLDIVIVTVPGTLAKLPPAAPAILKSTVEAAGFSCKTIDFNIKFYHLQHHNRQELENFFSTGLNVEIESVAEQLINRWVDEILEFDPSYVGISVFTYQNRKATELFCKLIKARSNKKIILGGQGLTDGGILGAQGFAKNMIAQSLADHYIKSEAEYSLVELLKGNFDYPGIDKDSFVQIEDLDSIPNPNYQDYELDLYENRLLPITASRGCVRACSFCDIHDHWKYNYRSGDLVAKEMIELHKKYNNDQFYFTDSLINGNLLEFKKMCKVLAEYNTLGNNINWLAQYIVRAAKHLNEDYWSTLAKSGATKLAIGVETGSDNVRQHMNKKFTNDDLDYTMEMLEKYNISCIFLIIVGYPTETEKEFQETLAMFEKYKHLASNTIIDVNIGSTLGILPGTPLYNNASKYHIDIDTHENNWIANDNPELTLFERLRRIQVLRDHIEKLGYTANKDADGLIQILSDNIEKFEKRNKIKKMIHIKEQK